MMNDWLLVFGLINRDQVSCKKRFKRFKRLFVRNCEITHTPSKSHLNQPTYVKCFLSPIPNPKILEFVCNIQDKYQVIIFQVQVFYFQWSWVELDRPIFGGFLARACKTTPEPVARLTFKRKTTLSPRYIWHITCSLSM